MMNPKLRSFLEANGLKRDASEAEAWALYHQLRADGVDFPGIDPGVEPGQRSAGGGGPAAGAGTGGDGAGAAAGAGAGDGAGTGGQRQAAEPPAPGLTAEQVAEAARAAVIADRKRCTEIEDRLRAVGLYDDERGAFRRQLLDDPGCSVERAASLILGRLQQRNPAIGAGAYGSMSVGVEAPEKFRAAVLDGLCLRSGIRIEKPADGAREFRGRSLIDICRESLELAGVATRSMGRLQLVGRALAAGSTSDFPQLMSALVGKHLLKAYIEWPSTFRPFVAVTDAVDFKELHAIKLSGSPDLLALNENGEYQHATFTDAKESYRVVTKGRIVALTRQMIINDDLRAFTRIPQLFGTAAKRMEGDAVYSLITGNPLMADGVAVFDAGHYNLAGTGGTLSSATLSAGRAAMRAQVGLNGEAIDVQPAFLITPVAMETEAEVLLRSAALPTADYSAGVHNPWAGKLTPIADPRLDAADPKAWYLAAHPNQVALIEVAYLEGEEQPYIEEEIDFDSDALKIKVRHDFGAGLVDHVAGYKNGGPAGQ
ncbi:hypothetical protein [Desulfofustis limnaeus]|nr:hypothetical protein [Desulfofustis limnaeus]